MPIYNSKLFPESELAHRFLDGLKGLEIGGAAHNAFGLDTLNVDRVSVDHPSFKPYADEQMRLCGEIMPVDIVAPGDCIPVDDKSFDFVISSHVIEHFFDPIGALKEWMRISRQYIFIICPQPDALESDKAKGLTSLEEHIARHTTGVGLDGLNASETDDHHSRWTSQTFAYMTEWIFEQEWGYGWQWMAMENPDKKVGNGFTIVLRYAA